MVVRAIRNNLEVPFSQLSCQCLGIFNYLSRIYFKFWLQSLTKSYCLLGGDVLAVPLSTRENRFIQLLAEFRVTG